MTIDKEYFQKYYQDHKKEYRDRDRRWLKNNPEKAKARKERYLEKLLGKRKKTTNKTDYSVKSLKDSYIKRYGKKINKMKDDVTNVKYKIRIFCLDCIEYKGSKFLECPGWEKCIYKEEILETIKNQKIKKGG